MLNDYKVLTQSFNILNRFSYDQHRKLSKYGMVF